MQNLLSVWKSVVNISGLNNVIGSGFGGLVGKMRHLPELRSRATGDSRSAGGSSGGSSSKKRLSGLKRAQVKTRSQKQVKSGVRKDKSVSSPKSATSPAASQNGTARVKNGVKKHVNGVVKKNRSSLTALASSTLNSPPGKPRTATLKRCRSDANGTSSVKKSASLTNNSSISSSVKAKYKREERRRFLRQRLKRYSEDIQEKSAVLVQEANDKARRKEKAARAARLKKRRSELWVLNCEAEEFLFGETAADKHEVELPPISPPRKKRRRMKIEESQEEQEKPVRKTKSRAPAKSSSEDDGSSASEEKEKPVKAKRGRKPKSAKTTGEPKPPKLAVSGRGGKTSPDVTSDDTNDSPPNLLRESTNYELTPVASPLSFYSSESSLSHFPDRSPKNNSARLQNILGNMGWKYSFEELPTDEVWYSALKRQDNPAPADTSHQGYCVKGQEYKPLTLPYETRVNARGVPVKNPPRKKGGRLPRQSPRCHASTLAILSSLKRGRGRPPNNVLSQLRPLSPLGSHSAVAEQQMLKLEEVGSTVEGPAPKIRKMTKRKDVSLPSTSFPVLGPVHISCPKSTVLPPVSPPLLSPVSSPGSPTPNSSPNSSSFSNRLRNREISATQYLWDSIQLLSDPYVIETLSENRPKKATTEKISRSKGPISRLNGTKKESLSITMSKQKSSTKLNGTVNGIAESRTSKPVTQNGKKSSSANKCNALPSDQDNPLVVLSSGRLLRTRLNSGDSSSSDTGSGTGSGKFRLKSPSPSSSPHNSSSIGSRKSTRNNPVVLISDILKNGSTQLKFINASSCVIPLINNNNNNNSTTINGKCKAVPSSTKAIEFTLDQPNLVKFSQFPSPSDDEGIVGDFKMSNDNEDLLFLMEGIPPLPAWPM